MEIIWIEVKNVKEYVYAMLKWQAEDIPDELIKRGKWIQNTVNISEVQPGLSLIEMHDKDLIHIKRRDSFIEALHAGAPILPLIILNCERGDRYLVDGYARFRALKKLGVTTVQVLKQTEL